MNNARVRVSLAQRELEVEGSEEFVRSFEGDFRDLLSRIGEVPPDAAAGAPIVAPAASAASDGEMPPFGEALHSLPRDASGTDQILLAGWYAQSNGTDGTFATNDASSLLVDQGIKLSNPTQSLNNNQTAKRVFKVGKRWKIARSGEEHLRALGIEV